MLVFLICVFLHLYAWRGTAACRTVHNWGKVSKKKQNIALTIFGANSQDWPAKDTQTLGAVGRETSEHVSEQAWQDNDQYIFLNQGTELKATDDCTYLQMLCNCFNDTFHHENWLCVSRSTHSLKANRSEKKRIQFWGSSAEKEHRDQQARVVTPKSRRTDDLELKNSEQGNIWTCGHNLMRNHTCVVGRFVFVHSAMYLTSGIK